jgi:SAM-dependent methyltransferase
MKQFQEKYPLTKDIKILEVGSYNVNGSYRDLWKGYDYVGIDIVEGPGVDIVVPENYYHLGCSFDLIISGQCIEHCARPWLLCETIGLHLKKDALFFLAAPFRWEIHNHPKDYWRFCPDGLAELIKIAGCEVLECGLDGDDCYGVGRYA